MTALLTENLPLLAGAPNGIKKLRELILELAVRGKLIPQDPSDEPASELLTRIAEEKARLAAEGKIKKQKSLAEVGEEAEPFELPAGWKWSSLAQVAFVNPRNAAADSLEASFVPMTFIGTRFDDQHGQEPRLWGELKQGFTHFAEGDIGVAKITPCFENSKACVFSNLANGLGAGTTELHIVRPITGTLDPRYVLAYLKSPQFLLVGETKMTGTAGQKRLPKDFVEANPFPLPPLAEQHRIVAKVDELMVLCDRLEAQQADAESAHTQLVQALLDSLTQASDAPDFATNWQRLTKHFHTLFTTEPSIDALKQTLLQLAVMGKLIPNTQEHTTSDHQPESERYKHPGLDFKVPMHWSIKNLEQLSQSIVDCPHSTPKWTESGVICVRTSQFKAGRLDLSSSKYVSEETYLERTQRLEPKVNDILYSREGGILGIACRIPQGARLCLGQRMMLIRPHSDVLPQFVEMTLNSPLITSIARNKTTGGAAPRVNVSVVKAYPIPLPPLAEQHLIVAKVDQLMALCDQLKTRLTQARQLNEQLASTLVEQAVA